MLYYEFCKIFINSFFIEQFRWQPLKIVSSLYGWPLWDCSKAPLNLDFPDYFYNYIWWATFANWNPNSVSVICGVTWCAFVHHLPCHKKGSDINCAKLWTFFCKFYVLSIKFSCTAPFTLLKLLQSWFHPSASSVFNPVKFKARFLFCDCLSLLFIDAHSVFCSVSYSRSFHPHYRYDQSHCVHLKVPQVGRFLLPLSLLPDLSDSMARNLLHISLQIS